MSKLANSILQETTKLNNGVLMPKLGLGVWKTANEQAEESVAQAIKHGYRLIDTAKQYGNQAGVGAGIKRGILENGLNRKDLFITTKVFNGDQGYDSTLRNFEKTLQKLQLSYLDLYLIHWPVDNKYIDTWKALEKLYRDGRVRAIGISNFDIEHTKALLAHSDITPAINQMEFNPINQEKDILSYMNLKGIQMEAWSPLGGGEALSNPTIKKLATKYNKSVAQIILRFDKQMGVITIPKSTHVERIVANSQINDFTLTAEDMATIKQLDKGQRSLWYKDFAWHAGHKPNAYVDAVQTWD